MWFPNVGQLAANCLGRAISDNTNWTDAAQETHTSKSFVHQAAKLAVCVTVTTVTAGLHCRGPLAGCHAPSVIRVLVRKRPDAVLREHNHGILCGAGPVRGKFKLSVRNVGPFTDGRSQ